MTQDDHFPDLPYRPCVGLAVFNPQGLVFVGHRAGLSAVDPHAWQMPQGGIDKDEEPYEAARRELYEETGMETATLLGEAPDWLNYDLPASARNKWTDRYRGQTQKWFALQFDGEEREIRLDLHGKPEFDIWKWVPLAKTTHLVVPFKRPVYEEVARVFAEYASAVSDN